MDVSNPRRVLALSLDSHARHLDAFIHELTASSGPAYDDPPSSSPPRSSSPASLAGTTRHLALGTRYYTARIPIWLDLVADPADWAATFLTDEAREVLAVLGGLVVVFALPPPSGEAARVRELVAHAGRVLADGLGGWEWDGVRLAVGVGGAAPESDEWDEACAEAGMEFVHLPARGGSGGGRNEFGEKMGMDRVREALESNDWAGADDSGAAGDDDVDALVAELQGGQGQGADLDPEAFDFGFDKADFEGLKRAIWNAGADDDETAADAPPEGAGSRVAAASPSSSATGKVRQADRDGADYRAEQAPAGPAGEEHKRQEEALGDDDVARVERMMRRLQAAREAGEGMAEAQRRRMAARAVAEVMREL